MLAKKGVCLHRGMSSHILETSFLLCLLILMPLLEVTLGFDVGCCIF